MNVILAFWIALGAQAKSAPKEKLNCADKELARQDCHLESGEFDMRLLTKTVAWTDGTWHMVDPVPLKGEAVEWERIGFRRLGKRPILQFWLWEKGVGETQVQSLHWYVAEFANRKMTVLNEGIVRKRRLEPAPPAAAPAVGDTAKKSAAKAPPAPPKYLYDGWEPHLVRALPNGDLEWQLSGQKKILPKTEKVKDGI